MICSCRRRRVRFRDREMWEGGMLKSCGGDVVVGSCRVLVELKSGVSQAQGSWIGVGLAGVQ